MGQPGSEIAWAGWRLPVPDDWRPLKIEGEHGKGRMMIGDAEQPIVLLQWLRTPGRESFDAGKWIDDRFRKLRVTPEAGAPAPQDFDRAAWVPDLERKEGEARTVWCGYAAKANLLIEVVMTNLSAEPLRRRVYGSLVPTLAVSPVDGPCRWALYNVSFETPGGFEMKRRHLYSGDIAFWMEKKKGESVLVRQVYPADLALSKRSPERWLEAGPFLERRRLRTPRTRPWTRESPIRLEGIERSGWKKLPSPMGWCRPRFSWAIAARDGNLDRLLMAEHLAGSDRGAATAEWMMERMNG